MGHSSSHRSGPPADRSSDVDLYTIDEDAPTPGLQINVTDADDTRFELKRGQFFKISKPVVSASPTMIATPDSEADSKPRRFETDGDRFLREAYEKGMRLLSAYVATHGKKLCGSSTAASAAKKLLKYADLKILPPDPKNVIMTAAEYATLDNELSEIVALIKVYLNKRGRPMKPEILNKEDKQYKAPATRLRSQT